MRTTEVLIEQSTAVLDSVTPAPISTRVIESISREAPNFLPTAIPTDMFSPAPSMNGYAGLEIAFERLPCLGTCPAYKVEIYGSGEGIYEGKSWVEVEGKQEFRVDYQQLSDLVEAFNTAHFFSLEDYYPIALFDLPSSYVFITFQGHTKTVGHNGWCSDTDETYEADGITYDAAPETLCNLEADIERIVDTEQWVGK